MSELSGFFAFNFDEGVASISVTPNGLTFNKSVAMKLDFPAYAVLLMNPDAKQIALQACDESTPRAIPFYKAQEKSNAARSVRWNHKDLLNYLSEMMGWNLHEMSYRVDGKLLPHEHAILFDLSKAKEMG